MRIALGLEYNGATFHGWQRQSHQPATIQHILGTALSRVANQSIMPVCAGRTDAGVHALGQVIHFDTDVSRVLHAWVMGSNNFLPKQIRVQWAKQVPDTFHARFSAIGRSYRYLIANQIYLPSLLYSRVHWEIRKLDIDAMHEASQFLLGKHDFSSFRDRHCQSKSPIRQVEQIKVYSLVDPLTDIPLIALDIQANAFLHHMVRNIVGTLLLVGRGEKTSEWLQDVLDARDRRAAGPTISPSGLCLMQVIYPKDCGL